MQKMAITIGKVIRKIMKARGRGSSYPGKVALTLYPNLLQSLEWPKTVIFVTGTNGKTSTTHYIAQMFMRDGYEVLTNAQGANLIQGIATVAIEHADLSGKIHADVAILEIDEGFFPTIAKQLPPSHLVITNLFPDQIDRLGSPDEVMKSFNKYITKHTKLFLNGLDPRLVKIGIDHSEQVVVYYGVEKQDFKYPVHPMDCPHCGETLHYLYPVYEQIGYFDCKHCGFKTSEMDYLAESISLTDQNFTLNHINYHIPQNNIYTLFNTLAAIAVADSAGVRTETIQQTLSSRLYVRGRNDQILLGDQMIPISLAKNPASMNQTLTSMLGEATAPFNLLLAINNAPADGVDTSWLNFVDFSLLNKRCVVTVFVSGTAAHDVKANLIEANIPEELIIIGSHKEGLDHLKSLNADNYIIANYTALSEIYSIIQ